MYPILVALLVIHAFWMYYDIMITSHQRHRPKRKPVRVTDSSPLSPFYPPSPGMEYNGFTRAFPVWDSPFPCGHLENEHDMRTRASATEGLFYVKEIETSSTIFSSVTTRIARKMGRRQQQQQFEDGTFGNDGINGNQKNVTGKVCTTRVVSQRARRFQNRSPQKSFLWSVVREPVSRLISKYYHYGDLKTDSGKRQNTVSKFQQYVINNENQDFGYYFRSLNVNRNLNPYNRKHEAHIQELLESYKFLGISERMDESLAVLKIILDLDIQDVLYLPTPKAKASVKNTDSPPVGSSRSSSSSSTIDYYENWKRGECRPISTPEVTLEMKEWFYSEEFEAFIEADVMFYKAVNASLDKTISELGRERVETTVKQLQWAQSVLEEECQHVRFPCSSEGEFQKETDCFFSDIGCGYDCLDKLGQTFPEDPDFLKII